jgi:hypothetical protein
MLLFVAVTILLQFDFVSRYFGKWPKGKRIITLSGGEAQLCETIPAVNFRHPAHPLSAASASSF